MAVGEKVFERFVTVRITKLPSWQRWPASSIITSMGLIGLDFTVLLEDQLKIGPYQGGHGCLVIPFDRAVCGTAARDQKIKIVDDVKKFDRYIICSESTGSELVIPCFGQDGELSGVLDIDSDQPAFFTKQDANDLDQLMLKLLMRGMN